MCRTASALQVAAFRVRLAPGPDGPDIQLPYPTPPRAGARRPPGVAASPPPPPPEDPKPYGNGVWWPLEVPKPYEWTVGRAAVILPPDMLSGDSVTDLRVAVCFTAATIPAGIIGMDTFIATLKPGASLLTARRGTTNGFAGHHHHHRHYQHRRALQSQLSGEEHEQEFQQQGGLLAEQQDPAVGSDAGVGRRLTSHEGTPPSDVNFDLPPPYRPPPPWPPGQAVVLGNTVVAQLGRGGRRVLLLRRAGIQAACIVGCLQVGAGLSDRERMSAVETGTSLLCLTVGDLRGGTLTVRQQLCRCRCTCRGAGRWGGAGRVRARMQAVNTIVVVRV